MYGFALVYWATISHHIPFHGYDEKMLIEGVIDEGALGDRPQLRTEWPEEIQRQLRKGMIEIYHFQYSIRTR